MSGQFSRFGQLQRCELFDYEFNTIDAFFKSRRLLINKSHALSLPFIISSRNHTRRAFICRAPFRGILFRILNEKYSVKTACLKEFYSSLRNLQFLKLFLNTKKLYVYSDFIVSLKKLVMVTQNIGYVTFR